MQDPCMHQRRSAFATIDNCLLLERSQSKMFTGALDTTPQFNIDIKVIYTSFYVFQKINYISRHWICVPFYLFAN